MKFHLKYSLRDPLKLINCLEGTTTQVPLSLNVFNPAGSILWLGLLLFKTFRTKNTTLTLENFM